MKILIAYSHQILRYGLKLLLRDIWPKAIFLEAESFTDAVNQISNNNIGLVIFDLNLPGAEQLEELLQFIITETKLMILCDFDKAQPRLLHLQEKGALLIALKKSSIQEIKQTFLDMKIMDKAC